MKKMSNKNAYMAPMVEVMNARVEKGFEMSGSAAPTTDPHADLSTDMEPLNPDENIID